ncbi:hypothetical protein KFE25_010329 [Diacronema lutheri]|uniref:Zeta toxin domain-containing protein n=1 Tax=Diacronema lutheri TaxID=2081491 RepID=A0A8J6C757_DIALT|nr:hypothetical protein KFE25_010329 [Diacronema lutheri]
MKQPSGVYLPRGFVLLVGIGLAMLTALFSIVRRASRGNNVLTAPPKRHGATGAAAAGARLGAHAPTLPSSPLLPTTRPTTSFVVPIEYDYTRSTRENYQAQRGEGASYGAYADIRDALDKDYHGTYTRARQAMQDELVAQLVAPGKPYQRTPWIVFTAGAMGAGKSHTIRWMAQRDIFPLENIVHIDSDLFKAAFPEWPGYVSRDPLSAGRHTRHESGYLVEIAQEAALRLGKHVWVDGSLRDCDWYKRVFAQVRRDHPDYQIAILYVTADEEQIAARVRKRAELTGRHVPEAEIRDSLQRVPRSVAALAPCAHFLAVIDNSRHEPQLAKWCEHELCYLQRDRWDEIKRRFGTTHADSAGAGGGAAGGPSGDVGPTPATDERRGGGVGSSSEPKPDLLGLNTGSRLVGGIGSVCEPTCG